MVADPTAVVNAVNAPVALVFAPISAGFVPVLIAFWMTLYAPMTIPPFCVLPEKSPNATLDALRLFLNASNIVFIPLSNIPPSLLLLLLFPPSRLPPNRDSVNRPAHCCVICCNIVSPIPVMRLYSESPSVSDPVKMFWKNSWNLSVELSASSAICDCIDSCPVFQMLKYVSRASVCPFQFI